MSGEQRVTAISQHILPPTWTTASRGRIVLVDRLRAISALTAGDKTGSSFGTDAFVTRLAYNCKTPNKRIAPDA